MGDLEIKNKKISIMLLSALLLSSTMILLVKASTSQRISADTGEVDLSMGVKVKIGYEASVSINKPTSAQAGDTKNWDIQLNDGSLSISVYVPSPINEWYTVTKSVPIGSSMDIPLQNGVSARVKILSSTPVNINGAASSDVDSLAW